MKHPEQALHRQVVEFLSLCLGGAAWFTTFPLGGGGYNHGARNKQLGAKPGTPDILVIDGGKARWIELKAPKGRVSEVQTECHKALAHAGSPVHVCRSLDEVIAALEYAGVPLRLSKAA